MKVSLLFFAVALGVLPASDALLVGTPTKPGQDLSYYSGLAGGGSSTADMSADAGASSGGESGVVCGGGVYCGAGEYCKYEEAEMCGEAAAVGTASSGVCAEKPAFCTLQYAPVCGCDGKTYGNACGAAGAGVSVRHQGACADEGGPKSGGVEGGKPTSGAVTDRSTTSTGGERQCIGIGIVFDCESGEYCRYADGTCGRDASGTSVHGVCAAVTRRCTREYKPVCGCDGKTYGNACVAAGAGVSLLHHGECRVGDDDIVSDSVDKDSEEYGDDDPEHAPGAAAESKECATTSDCGTGSYCSFTGGADAGAGGYGEVGEGGVCGGDVTGRCYPRPDACVEVYAPVCGCDGSTYDNACTALGAGVVPSSSGSCTFAMPAVGTDRLPTVVFISAAVVVVVAIVVALVAAVMVMLRLCGPKKSKSVDRGSAVARDEIKVVPGYAVYAGSLPDGTLI